MTIDETLAKRFLKPARTFVDGDDYEEFKTAVLQASPSGESQGKTTALIAHGRLLALRDFFQMLEGIARPPAELDKKRGGKRDGAVDPDLDTGDDN